MELKYQDGLIPAIVQDPRTGKVLMLGYMNDDAYRKTVETGYVTFFSRSRQTLWTKGETSGHRLSVREVRVDFDRGRIERLRVLPRRLRKLFLPQGNVARGRRSCGTKAIRSRASL
jgi:phosphoribosyl-AMP cyclohydrolase